MKINGIISKENLLNLLWVVFFSIAVISLIQGFHNAIIDGGSSDMQWSPSKLLLAGVDPYRFWLNGNPGGQIIEYQIPNYLHTLYLLMLPLAVLNWDAAKIFWALINAALGILTALYLGKKANLTKKNQLIILLLFLCSTPFRNSMGNGQQSIFVLFFAMLSFYCHSNISYIVSSSLAIIKYSFAPPLIFYEYYKNGLNRIFGIITFTSIAILIFSLITKANPISLLAEPLIVSKTGASNGMADIMSMCSIFLPTHLGYVGYLFSLVFSCYLVYVYYKKNIHGSLMLDFAYISLISLISFKHQNYDFVFLLPLTICAKDLEKTHRIFIYTVIFWFWFGTKALGLFVSYHFWDYLIPIHFSLLLKCTQILGYYSQKNPLLEDPEKTQPYKENKNLFAIR